MEVRAVRVKVPQRLMLVPVRVPLGRRQPRMLVEMVAVVVPMAVDVGERLVGVEVVVTVEQEQGDGRNEETTCQKVRPLQRLPEHEPRQRGADERRTREDGLRPRGALLVGGRDV